MNSNKQPRAQQQQNTDASISQFYNSDHNFKKKETRTKPNKNKINTSAASLLIEERKGPC